MREIEINHFNPIVTLKKILDFIGENGWRVFRDHVLTTEEFEASKWNLSAKIQRVMLYGVES